MKRTDLEPSDQTYGVGVSACAVVETVGQRVVFETVEDFLHYCYRMATEAGDVIEALENQRRAQESVAERCSPN